MELGTSTKSLIWCLHCIDLQKALAGRAEELGIRLVFKYRIPEVDLASSAIVYENGQMETGKIVVAADDLWSSTRSSLLRRALLPKPTGDIAYRVVLGWIGWLIVYYSVYTDMGFGL